MRTLGRVLLQILLLTLGVAGISSACAATLEIYIHNDAGLQPAVLDQLMSQVQVILTSAGDSVEVRNCHGKDDPWCQQPSAGAKVLYLRILPGEGPKIKNMRNPALGASVADETGGAYGAVRPFFMSLGKTGLDGGCGCATGRSSLLVRSRKDVPEPPEYWFAPAPDGSSLLGGILRRGKCMRWIGERRDRFPVSGGHRYSTCLMALPVPRRIFVLPFTAPTPTFFPVPATPLPASMPALMG